MILSIAFDTPFDVPFQLLDSCLLSRGDVGTSGDATAAALGMAEFQEVRQLVAVPGVDRHLKGVGAFLGVLYRPALGIGSGAVWRCS